MGRFNFYNTPVKHFKEYVTKIEVHCLFLFTFLNGNELQIACNS